MSKSWEVIGGFDEIVSNIDAFTLEIYMHPIRMYYHLMDKPFGEGDKAAYLYANFDTKTTRN